jgi:MoaA/NifB/PqqE/SkfB family radical SAM enzyme
MTDVFSLENITEFQIEVTTHCNAACPQCPRNINGGETNPHLTVQHLSREAIDSTFNKSLCNHLKQIFFCGSYGDPIVHPEFLNIVKDFRKKSKTLWIYIHTNGGVRNAEWWKELAETIGDYGKIDFNIDGLDDTNHLYRRNVSFDKAMENAKAFIDSGGKAQWNFIVFKHNEHQVDTAKMLSNLWGFENIVFRGTGRFLNHKTLEKSNQWKVTPKKGKEYYLKPTDIKKYSNQSIENLPKLKEEYNNIKDYFNNTPIKCDALAGKKVVITGEGLVLPCNFFEHNLYDARFKDENVDPSSP